jgi:hypothetical protein
MIIYGVFCEDVLIFSDEGTYAIYEKENSAESFRYEMHTRFLDTDYNVRPIEFDVKAARIGP